MPSIVHSRPRAAVVTLALVALTTMVTCSKKGGSSGKSGEPADACDKYAAAVCTNAGGPASSTCASVKTVTAFLPHAACQAALADIPYAKAKIAEGRKVCDELGSKLCEDLSGDADGCKMVRDEINKFLPERCTGMLGNYAEVLKDVRRMAAKNKPLSSEAADKLAAGDLPSFGPKDAKVTIVEFSDFQCPYCTQAAAVVKQIEQKYEGKVRFVFRQFPLDFHKEAEGAAIASLAANAQGKFWSFHDALFANQSELTAPDLEKHAKESGLDVAKWKKAIKDPSIKARVQSDVALGGEIGVTSTPSMFVNGKRVLNSTQFEPVAAVIDAALKAAN